MSILRKLHGLMFWLLCGVLAGCATGRTVISLPMPAVTQYQGQESNGKLLVIRAVTDERTYEDAPGDPSIPSLSEVPASRAAADLKARAVARKRNGYGMAQGDVVLKEPESVLSIVQANADSAFATTGFRVAALTEVASTQAQVVNIRIKQFWLWLQPGLMVGTIRSRIVTELQFDGLPPVQVAAETSQPGQIFSEEAWTKAVLVATEEYRRVLVARLEVMK